MDFSQVPRLRILLCGINYDPDLVGIAKYNTELCEALHAKGHEVQVITAPPYYPAWRVTQPYKAWQYGSEVRNGVAVRRAPIYVPRNPSGVRRLLHHASFAATSSVPLLVKAWRWRPHVVFAVAPSLMSAPAAALAARIVGAKSWLHIQDLEVDAAFNLGLLRGARSRRLLLAVERRIMNMFDRVSTISPAMARNLEQKGVPADKLRQLRNWVDVAAIRPENRAAEFRTQFNIAADDIVVLYSGNMSNKQGIDIIVDAARRLRGDHPKIHVLLCGDGPQKSVLRKLAAGFANVHFLDLQPADRFPSLLSTADIHVLPQRLEAADLVLPSKLGGMLASGRPVVVMASKGTGLAQEVADAGVIVPPGDAAALAAAIADLASNAERRAMLGAHARVRAKEQWNLDAIIQKLDAELAALCDRSAEAPTSGGERPAGLGFSTTDRTPRS